MSVMLDQSAEGRELSDAMQRSSLDIINATFTSDRIKIHLLRVIAENLQLPDELGTGMGVYVFVGIMHAYGVSQPMGGSSKLSETLRRCIEHRGGEVRCQTEVRKVLTAHGQAHGVELADGERIEARDGVIAALHPHVIRRFIDELDPGVTSRGERATLPPFSLFISHYYLQQQGQFHAGPEMGRDTMLTLLSTGRLDELLDDFDMLPRGRVSSRRLFAGDEESINDPSRVSPGKGMFHGMTFPLITSPRVAPPAGTTTRRNSAI